MDHKSVSAFHEVSHLATQAHFDVSNPESLTQFAGTVELKKEDRKFKIHAEVGLAFSPKPRPEISFSSENLDLLNFLNLTDGEVHLTLPGHKQLCSVILYEQDFSINGNSSTVTARGLINEHFELFADERIGRVHFALLNHRTFHGEPLHSWNGACTWSGRAVLHFGNWKVTLDERYKASEFIESTKRRGGYDITHVGILERNNRKLFGSKDANKVLEALFWIFTFTNSAYTSCVLPHGFRHEGHPVWVQLSNVKSQSDLPSQCWFPVHQPEKGFSISNSMFTVLNDDTHDDWLRLAVSIYISACQNIGGAELALSQAQIALELLCNVIIQERNSILSDEGLDKLPAADRIRVALLWANIPKSIPTTFSSLSFAFAKQKSCDGPTAITEIRNALIHPSKLKRIRLNSIPRQARFEAWQLSLHYVELLILKLLDYQGPFTSRITAPGQGGVEEMVPWVN